MLSSHIWRQCSWWPGADQQLNPVDWVVGWGKCLNEFLHEGSPLDSKRLSPLWIFLPGRNGGRALVRKAHFSKSSTSLSEGKTIWNPWMRNKCMQAIMLMVSACCHFFFSPTRLYCREGMSLIKTGRQIANKWLGEGGKHISEKEY